MRKPLFGAIAGAALAVAVVVGSTGIAQAANVDTSRISQTITGVGSDTLYEVQSDLDELYNEAVGCAIIPSPNPGGFVNYQQTCFNPNDTTGTVPGDPGLLPYGGNIVVKGNLYHDRAVEAYPVGSGSGTKVLSQFTSGNPAVSSDFARASSKQTYAVIGFQQYGVAYGRDGAGYWVGRNNKLVAHTKAGVPTPNATLPRLKGAFIGTGSGKCLINWSKSKGNSIGTKQGNPGAGTIDIFATQAGSGSGKDFLQKIDPANAATYTDASALQNCVPAKYKDGNPNNGEHVLVENQARPICSQKGGKKSFQSTALFPYAFLRFVQNRAATGTCAGLLGSVNGIKPTIASMTRVSGPKAYPMGSYRYDYFLLPNPLPSAACTGRDGSPVAAGVNLNNQNTWTVSCGLTARQVATLDYLAPNKGFLCRTDSVVNPLTGRNYRTEIAAKLKADGIAPLPKGAIGGSSFTGASYCRDAAAT